MEGVLRIERKLDLVLSEVQVRNAQNDALDAKLDYLIAVERENRRKIEDVAERERMSFVLPPLDDPM